MRKTFLSLCITFALGGAASFAQTNLVKNPGFEEPATAAGLPGGGWWLYQGTGETTATVDTAAGHSGSASVKLQSDAASKSVMASAPFPVMAGDELRFETWARSGGTEPQTVQAGLAFRDADNKVFKRAYFTAPLSGGTWTLISGNATAPEGTASAEIHLGYTNSPAPIWYDDILAVITSPVSFALVEGAKPWTGPQYLTVTVINRDTNQFHGSISALVARRSQSVPVSLDAGFTHQFTIPINLTGVGSHNYKLSLLDAKGAALRVVEGKFQTKSPLALYPPCPCYHLVGEGTGNTRIDARVNINPTQRLGVRLKVEVTDAHGSEVQTATADVGESDLTNVTVRVPISAPAAFSVTARLVDRAGLDLAVEKSQIRVCPAQEARVTVAPNGFLIVGGKPEFPIGLYSSGHEEEMGKAGFTATHNYGITTGDASDPINPNDAHLLELLDRSWANGMRMMVELPRKPIEKGQWAQIHRRIETFRNHPGLLCWGSEERVARSAAPLKNVQTLYGLVHALDPNHPFVLGDTRDVIQKLQVDRRNFFPDDAMDIGIWWWYPIPLKEPDGNGLTGGQKVQGVLEPPSWLTTTTSKKPLWLAFQAYQKPSKDARYPTPDEYRCQAYLSIINGVKGLWFYTGSGQKDFQGKPAGLLNKLELSHWDYAQKLTHELREFSPVIMAPTNSSGITLSPADAPVQFATRELDGKTYLIAANRSERAQSVKFSGDALKGKRAQVLYESHSTSVEGDTLTDDFVPFGVHIYLLN